MVKKGKHKESEIKSAEKLAQNPKEYIMEQVMIGCKVPRIVKLILVNQAQSEGSLLSEVVRKYIYGLTGWDKEEKRKKYFEELLKT